tara:strand:+ start:222 stop:3224 length:3003 start_codon:yes stop_codon:yes gene_type:complete
MSLKTQQGTVSPNSVLVSHFKTLKTKQPTLLGVEQMLFDIQQPNPAIASLRQYAKEGNKEAYKEGKVNLPLYRLNGAFKGWSDSDLIEANGLMTIDLDKFPNLERLQEERELLELIPFVYAVFLSPSGIGLKALIRIPKVKTAEEYTRRFLAFKNVLKSPYFDDSNSNVSRACFTSYDPKPYINLDAEIFERIEDIEQPKPKVKAPIINYGGVHPFAKNKLEQLANNIANAPEGEKHEIRRSNARTIGGFCATGQIDEREALNILIDVAVSNSTTKRQAEKTILDAFRNGAKYPLYFDEVETYNYKETALKRAKKEGNIFSIDYDKIGKSKEAVNFIIDTINSNKITSIQAPANSGKTSVNIHLIKEVYKNERHIIIAPTQDICKQTAKKLNVQPLIGRPSKDELEYILSNNVIVTTYNSFAKLSNDLLAVSYLWIDEADSLSRSKYQKRKTSGDVCQIVISSCNFAKKTILYTATPEPLINDFLEAKFIKLELPTQDVNLNLFTYDWGKSKQAIFKHLEGLNYNFKHICRIDSLETIKQLKTALEEEGIKVQAVASDEEITNSIEYKDFITSEYIDKDVQLILATSKINEGVNILNEDIQSIIIAYTENNWVNGRNINKDLQFPMRARRSSGLNCTLIAPKPMNDKGFKNNIDKLLVKELEAKKGLFDVKTQIALKYIDSTKKYNYREVNLLSLLEDEEDKDIISINGFTLPCIPVIIEKVNAEYIQFLDAEEYAEFLAKKSDYLHYIDTNTIKVLKDEKAPKSEEKKNEKSEFLDLISKNDDAVYYAMLFNVANNDLRKKMDRLCSYLYTKPYSHDEIDAITDSLTEYKYIDVNKIYSQFIDLREKSIPTDEVLKLLNLTDSKFKKAKRQILFNISHLIMDDNNEDEIFTERQNKTFDKYHQIYLKLNKYTTGQKNQSENKFTLKELTEMVKNILDRKRMTDFEAKNYIKTVYDLKLLKDRRHYQIQINEYTVLNEYFKEFLAVYNNEENKQKLERQI